jgi:two-component sensor histidine kinase
MYFRHQRPFWCKVSIVTWGRLFRFKTGYFHRMINFQDKQGSRTLAQEIVNTMPEPLIVIDDQFRVVAASPSFYRVFKFDPRNTLGRPLYSLGDGQWNIPSLRVLLETIIPQNVAIEGFEIDHDFPELGPRTMLLNARQMLSDSGSPELILVSFMDVTKRRLAELEKDELLSRTEELLRQKDVLLREMEHRVANSLQIIASILLLKARSVSSAEMRQHLHDAHQRVMSVAQVQKHLHAMEGIDQIDVRSYLGTLCASLANSMVGEDQPIAVKVVSDIGHIGSAKAVSLGLIVTELVINAVKYAFPHLKAEALICVSYEIDGESWKLTVADNGVGKGSEDEVGTRAGLGTAIVQALVKQLDAVMDTISDSSGTKVSVTRAVFKSHTARAA